MLDIDTELSVSCKRPKMTDKESLIHPSDEEVEIIDAKMFGQQMYTRYYHETIELMYLRGRQGTSMRIWGGYF